MSLSKRVIPCLDVDKGRVVKGVQFVDIKDAGDPVEIAHRYDQQGADEITFLDITASSDNRNTIIDVVEKVAEQVFIPLTVGGGIRELKDIENLLKAGADKVAINTTAVKNPRFIKQASSHFGSQCIVVAMDAKRITPNDEPLWCIYTHGGRQQTRLDAIQWAQQVVALGAGELLVTSMDRDGTKDGFDLQLIKKISTRVSVPVIASGGIGNLQHLTDGILFGGADAVLAASIFHFNEYTITQAKHYMSECGIEIRETSHE